VIPIAIPQSVILVTTVFALPGCWIPRSAKKKPETKAAKKELKKELKEMRELRRVNEVKEQQEFLKQMNEIMQMQRLQAAAQKLKEQSKPLNAQGPGPYANFLPNRLEPWMAKRREQEGYFAGARATDVCASCGEDRTHHTGRFEDPDKATARHLFKKKKGAKKGAKKE
jgi:hypothetical protein